MTLVLMILLFRANQQMAQSLHGAAMDKSRVDVGSAKGMPGAWALQRRAAPAIATPHALHK